jgi:hypothetical protein
VIVLKYLRAIAFRYWALAGCGWIVLAAMWLPAGALVRVAAVYLFVLVGAGFSLAAMMTRDTAERWVLAIALSASLAILVSVVCTVLRNDSMVLRIALLATVNSVAALLLGIRANRQKCSATAVGGEEVVSWR